MTVALRVLYCGEPPGGAAFGSWPDTVVGYCASATLFTQYEQFNPNLFLIDGREDFGLALQIAMSIRAVRETASLPVVALAPDIGEEMEVRAFQCGIDEVLERLDDVRSWLRLQSLVRRNGVMSSNPLLRVGDIELLVEQRKVRRAGRTIALPARQFELLRFLMERPGQIFSRAELLRQCWKDPALDEGTVTACILRLRRALMAAGGPNPITSIAGGHYGLTPFASDPAEKTALPAG